LYFFSLFIFILDSNLKVLCSNEKNLQSNFFCFVLFHVHSSEKKREKLDRACDVLRFSFVADFFDVSLNKRVDFLNVDFAGFVVANLEEEEKEKKSFR
jgi:hypothetical protein